MSVEAGEYKGYALFDDIEDDELRANNRVAVMFNIINNSKPVKNSLRTHVTIDAINYFRLIPPAEREVVLTRLTALLRESGYKV